MDEQRLILLGLLAVLLAVPAWALLARARRMRARARGRVWAHDRRIRNIAWYRAWQWLHGKPRLKQLTDARAPVKRAGRQDGS